MDLKKSFASGVLWSAIARFAGQGMQTLTTIVLARMLSPKEFGIIGMANIFILFANTINQLGISSAIVQRKNVDEGHLSSAFWVNVFTGIVLCAVMVGISYPAAAFFRNDAVQPVLSVLSFIFIIGALRIVQNAQLTRHLEFKKLAYLEVIELSANSVMTLALAYWGWAVWSLVWGRLFGVFAGMVGAWFLSSWRPKWMLDLQKIKELFSFGVHALMVNILTYLGRNVDYIIVGRFLGTAPLGLYTMAYNLVTLPERKMSSIITGVAFPAFSRIQDDDNRVTKNYLKMLTYISFATFPLLFGLMVLTPHFVKVVLSSKWEEAIIPMQIMCILGLFNSIGTTMGSIFYAKGRPDIEFKTDLLNLMALGGALLIGVKFGIIGVAVTVTIVAMIGTPLIFWVIARLIKTPVQSIYWALHPALVSSVLMSAVMVSMDYLFIGYGVGTVARLIALIFIGIGTYFCVQKIFRFPILAEFWQMMKMSLAKKAAEAKA